MATHLIGQDAPQATERGGPVPVHAQGRPGGLLPQLSSLEWDVVRTAFIDASETSRGSSLRWLVGRFFALNPPQPLANPRLEKLRLFMCITRSTGAAPEELKRDLGELGFNEAQLRALTLLAAGEPSAL